MTGKQRAKLRAMANTFETILYIGKDGITDNTVKECYDALEARELFYPQLRTDEKGEEKRNANAL